MWKRGGGVMETFRGGRKSYLSRIFLPKQHSWFLGISLSWSFIKAFLLWSRQDQHRAALKELEKIVYTTLPPNQVEGRTHDQKNSTSEELCFSVRALKMSWRELTSIQPLCLLVWTRLFLTRNDWVNGNLEHPHFQFLPKFIHLL